MGPFLSSVGGLKVMPAHGVQRRTTPPFLGGLRGTVFATSVQNRVGMKSCSQRQARMLSRVAETVGPISKVPGPPPAGVDLDSPYPLKQVRQPHFRTLLGVPMYVHQACAANGQSTLS